MLECVLLSGQTNSPLFFDIKPIEAVGSKTVFDSATGSAFASLTQASDTRVIIDDNGDKALLFSGSNFGNGSVDLKLKNKPFKLSFDLLLTEYNPAEGAVYAHLDAGTGGGCFGATMTGGTGRLSFYWTRDGSLNTRSHIVSSQVLSLNTYHGIMIEYTGTSIIMYFDNVVVAQISANLIYSGPAPLGIGGHYGYGQYNSKGSMKNIKIELIA